MLVDFGALMETNLPLLIVGQFVSEVSATKR